MNDAVAVMLIQRSPDAASKKLYLPCTLFAPRNSIRGVLGRVYNRRNLSTDVRFLYLTVIV